MLQNNHKVATTSHSFSATSVSTYINDGQGAPKVYQAAVATRCAPGGVLNRNFSCPKKSNCYLFISIYLSLDSRNKKNVSRFRQWNRKDRRGPAVGSSWASGRTIP
jgi:hypothetical protein